MSDRQKTARKLYRNLPKTPRMLTPEEIDTLEPVDQMAYLTHEMARTMPSGNRHLNELMMRA